MPTKSSVFVDTSGWVEPLMHNSPSHATMDAYYRQLITSKRPLITTNYVIAEVVALLTARSLLERHDDKEWSLVDAASFVVLQQRGMTGDLSVSIAENP